MERVAAAIADPVRKAIVENLAVRHMTAGEIAALFPISRPAVSRHLRVLRESGLVREQKAGRHHVYDLRSEALDHLASWIEGLRPPGAWTARIDALETEVRRAVRDRRQRDEPEEETA